MLQILYVPLVNSDHPKATSACPTYFYFFVFRLSRSWFPSDPACDQLRHAGRHWKLRSPDRSYRPWKGQGKGNYAYQQVSRLSRYAHWNPALDQFYFYLQFKPMLTVSFLLYTSVLSDWRGLTKTYESLECMKLCHEGSFICPSSKSIIFQVENYFYSKLEVREHTRVGPQFSSIWNTCWWRPIKRCLLSLPPSNPTKTSSSEPETTLVALTVVVLVTESPTVQSWRLSTTRKTQTLAAKTTWPAAAWTSSPSLIAGWHTLENHIHSLISY